MVLPLLGLLAGGVAAGHLGKRYLEDRAERADADAMAGLLDNLGPGATQQDINRAMVSQGLLAPDEFAREAGAFGRQQAGFGHDQNMFGQRTQLEQSLLGQRLAADRDMFDRRAALDLSIAGAERDRANAEAFGTFNQGLIAEYQPQLEEQAQRVDRLSEIEGLMGSVGEMAFGEGWQAMMEAGDLYMDGIAAGTVDPRNTAADVVRQIPGVGGALDAMIDINSQSTSTQTPEMQQALRRLQELELPSFYDFQRSVYGDTEPSPRAQESLKEAYSTLSNLTTGGITGRELINSMVTVRQRIGDAQDEAGRIQGEYTRRLETYNRGNLVLPEGLRPTISSRGTADLLGRESGGNHQAVNPRTGAMGRAQFMPERLDDFRNATGMEFTDEQFRNDPELQREAETWHFNDLDERIEANGLDAYEGAVINGVTVTRQGMINAAHLGGFGGLQRFLESGGQYDPSDDPDNPDQGTRLSDYLRMGMESEFGRTAPTAMASAPEQPIYESQTFESEDYGEPIDLRPATSRPDYSAPAAGQAPVRSDAQAAQEQAVAAARETQAAARQEARRSAAERRREAWRYVAPDFLQMAD